MIYSIKRKLIDLDLLGLHAILGQERRQIATSTCSKQSSHGTYLNELTYKKKPHIQLKQIYIFLWSLQLSNNYKSTFIYSLKIVHIDQFQTQQDSRASLVAIDREEEIKVRFSKVSKNLCISLNSCVFSNFTF